MARISDDLHAGGPATGADHKIVLPSDAGTVKVPSNDFITHADIARDGQDLVLRTADGHTAVVKGYFSAEPHPVIHSPSGAILTPELVHSFVHHDGPAQYAATATANDASPVGAVREVHGHATVKHADGTSETVIVGTAIHEGDVVETDAAGAVNITFRDNSSFAVSHNAKLAIDEYVFDPHSDAGASNFSMLRGVFVYTSGLIGHQDPDDVHIHTPAGSIGIRGTIIAGDVDTGQITVVEGAIVLQSNTGEETVLSTQYATAQFNVQTGTITSDGTLSAGDLSAHYSSLNDVAPSFFSGLESTGTTTAPNGGTPDSAAPAPDGTTPPTPPADDNHGTQAAPDTTTTTASADTPLIITAATDTIGGDGGGAFSTDDIFSVAAGTTDSSGAGGISDTTPFSIAPPASSSTFVDTSSTGGSLSSVTATPIVGQIFAGNTTTTSTTPPVPPFDLLTINPLTGSAHGFWIIDGANEGFGSSTTVASNLSGGLDGLFLVKTDDSASGGQFYEVQGNTVNYNNLAVSGLTFHSADLIATGGDHNMVMASIGAFGPTSTPCFIIGAPFDDSLAAPGTGNISIVDSSGALIETVQGLGISGLNVGTALFGAAAAGIGDINNDGYADVLIGSPGIAGSDAGAAYVSYGSSTVSASSPLDLSALSPLTGFSITGAANANLGTDVNSAGDFNNDGQADFMISNPGTGIVDFYMQGSILTSPLVINVGSTTNTDIPLMNLGDVSGDGVSDIGIVANNHLYVYYGGTHSSPLGTVDANFSIATPAGTAITAGAIGDFNGDGKSDVGVIITNAATATADVYVVYGSGTLPLHTILTQADLDTSKIAFHMFYNGLPTADLSGMTISSAGDLNGDGFSDLVIGLPNLDMNPIVDSGTPGAGPTPDGNFLNDRDGASIVVYGQAGGTASYAAGNATAAGQSLVGTSNGDTLSDGGNANVSFSAGAGDDTINVNNGSLGKIGGGAGNDTLNFMGGGTLDFTGLGSERIARIEQIDMSGTAQGINLNMQNIFNLMDSSDTGNLVITSSGSSANTLTIHNAAGTGSPNTTGGLSAILGSGASFNIDIGNPALTDFHFGSHTLSIETALITAANVHVV